MKAGKEAVIGAAVASLLMGGTALAAGTSELFQAKELKAGYQLASEHHEEHHEAAAKKDEHHDKAKAEEHGKKEEEKGSAEKKCGEGSCKSKEKK